MANLICLDKHTTVQRKLIKRSLFICAITKESILKVKAAR